MMGTRSLAEGGLSKKVSIVTFGCKVNQADSRELAERYISEGYEVVSATESADVCVVNTCTVTAKADFQCRQMLRRLKKANPKAKIIAVGCYANVAAEELRKMSEVDEVVRDRFRRYLSPSLSPSLSPVRTRPQIKVQDGCNNYCTYCIVPYARGRSRSASPEEVLKQVGEFARSGCHEIVLTGIHLGAYGADLQPRTNLLDLLKLITIHPLRFRLSSIDPNEWSDELIKFVAANANICPHFHIPLQSGDNEILKRMGRKYTINDYRRIISKLKIPASPAGGQNPNCCIGSDVIVGFPGETKEHFERTRAFIESLPLTYLHVFPYSMRPLTAASKFKDTVTTAEKHERVFALREISLKKRQEYYRSQIGREMDVVIENKRDRRTGKLKGISANYMPVLLDGRDKMLGKRCKTWIIDAMPQFAFGRDHEFNR